MRRRLAPIITLVLAYGMFAPLAVAGPHDGGEGWYGETNDKAVTNYGFLLIAMFPVIIFVASAIQWKLDKRKDLRKRAAKARKARADLRGGW